MVETADVGTRSRSTTLSCMRPPTSPDHSLDLSSPARTQKCFQICLLIWGTESLGIWDHLGAVGATGFRKWLVTAVFGEALTTSWNRMWKLKSPRSAAVHLPGRMGQGGDFTSGGA